MVADRAGRAGRGLEEFQHAHDRAVRRVPILGAFDVHAQQADLRILDAPREPGGEFGLPVRANLGAIALRQPLALVLGAEGKGLRQLTRETCSVVARLDMPGEIKSLNVSNAAGLALYIGASRLGLMG